jgi:hypothetical protein
VCAEGEGGGDFGSVGVDVDVELRFKLEEGRSGHGRVRGWMGVGVQGKPKKGFRIGESSIGGIGPDRVSPFFYLVFFFSLKSLP